MAQKEIVLNIKLDAGEAVQQFKELAVNTGELKDRKKLLNDENRDTGYLRYILPKLFCIQEQPFHH
jgi:hypothetical protein